MSITIQNNIKYTYYGYLIPINKIYPKHFIKHIKPLFIINWDYYGVHNEEIFLEYGGENGYGITP